MSNSQDAMALARLVREGRRYWASPGGRSVWRAERACLGPLCERWFGVNGLELGMAPTLADMCPVRHALRWSPTAELAEGDATLVCPPDALPLPDGCLSLVVIHHLLEVAPDPHHLLQEAARVTDDDGHLILFGWAPFGVAGVSRLWPERRRHLPWRGRWRTPGRLSDWLAFVDFEAQRVDYCGFRLPGGTAHNAMLETLGRRHNLPLGDCYMIHARRRSQLAQTRRDRVAFPRPLAGSALGNASRQCGPQPERVTEGD
ncbi:class I SAM-dependent methyltransferase [Halomonas stenophila]|uniref:SAM-dependent methyltransferase n=1 Tax=Halomonas stenophila TaxID=795312 RepID=A0A7W5ESH8_9GAMM|nr:methyltransferase domain-containing protein [Halomonas stenophila]MBB3229846.1 SAM-dependent methyltransferase [Halomonas stenophila]